MSKVSRLFARLLLLTLLSLATFAAFWLGIIPQRFSPFSPLSLELKEPWFLDPRLAALRRDPALCQSILKLPHIESQPIADKPFKNGCGWTGAVKTTMAGGARLSVEPLTCEMAAAMTMWIAHELQPLATKMLGSPVQTVQDMGTYDCRNIVGNAFWKDVRSQHASANALDIAGFTLADGRQISVLRDWKGKGAESEFLHAAHASACRYFRVALGPEFNAAHKDHFHFDRGLMWTCK